MSTSSSQLESFLNLKSPKKLSIHKTKKISHRNHQLAWLVKFLWETSCLQSQSSRRSLLIRSLEIKPSPPSISFLKMKIQECKFRGKVNYLKARRNGSHCNKFMKYNAKIYRSFLIVKVTRLLSFTSNSVTLS